MTTFLNDALRAQLLANGLASAKDSRFDPPPVVKLFTPNAGATWLLSELDAEDIAFGLCDLGLGFPELGYVSLAELEAFRGRWGLPIERDAHFVADKPLSGYARRRGWRDASSRSAGDVGIACGSVQFLFWPDPGRRHEVGRPHGRAQAASRR